MIGPFPYLHRLAGKLEWRARGFIVTIDQVRKRPEMIARISGLREFIV